MAAAELAFATRSADKAREVRRILTEPAFRLLTLDHLGIPDDAAENAIEAFDSFRENALAKARHFAARTGLPTLADDSGLVVPALGGAPGVFSKRFARLAAESADPAAAAVPVGLDTDAANNALLLEKLRDAEGDERAAYYVCAAALVHPDGAAAVALGTCHGRIAREPRGTGGFGYDPLFLLPELGRTFGELPAAEKDARSHRGRAFRALATRISALLGD